MEVRKINKEEHQAALELITDVMKSEFPSDSGVYPLSDVSDISQAYGHIGEAFFVMVDKQKIIGTVAVKREDERTAFLRRIFVHKGYRGKKYGKKLLERAIGFCSEVGYQEIIFKTTSTMKSAIGLCVKQGFVERAKIDLGDIELLKFTLLLKDNIV